MSSEAPNNAVAENFLAYASRRMHDCRNTIAKCCDQLNEEQLWHRGGEHENSVANLLLHLEGNMRQWILHGIAGHPDVRTRDAEFTLTPTTDSATARARFNATLDESAAVIAGLPPARLLEIIDPQPTGTWRHCTILEGIFKVVGHVDHHAGQIILLTKQLAAHDLDLSMPRKR
jgi:uncharacterized damage-inducible protein DinB